MANKFTVTINATITTEDEQDALYAKVLAAVKGVGTNCMVQQMNINQWVDQYNSKPQVFNEDGTPYVEPTTDTTETSQTA